MKVWTVLLAGVLLAALPNLGNSALEDAGVFVSKTYAEFERRVIPANTVWISSNNFNEYEWFRINKFDQLLMDFENGNNTMKAKFRLGTPSILTAKVVGDKFVSAGYCKYLPKEFHNATGLRNDKASVDILTHPWEYYAMKINDRERLTILQGWNYLLKVVKARFPNNNPDNYKMLIVEKTAAGVIYVGTVQDNYE